MAEPGKDPGLLTCQPRWRERAEGERSQPLPFHVRPPAVPLPKDQHGGVQTSHTPITCPGEAPGTARSKHREGSGCSCCCAPSSPHSALPRALWPGKASAPPWAGTSPTLWSGGVGRHLHPSWKARSLVSPSPWQPPAPLQGAVTPEPARAPDCSLFPSCLLVSRVAPPPLPALPGPHRGLGAGPPVTSRLAGGRRLTVDRAALSSDLSGDRFIPAFHGPLALGGRGKGRRRHI